MSPLTYRRGHTAAATFRTRVWRGRMLLLSAVLAGTPGLASAALLLNVAGSNNTGATIQSNEAAAASFTLTSAVTNFTITAPLTCLSCAGGIWLQSVQIGPGALIGQNVDAKAYDNSTTTPFFSEPSLAAGTYFLVVSITSGSTIWLGSNPVVTTGSGATLGPDFFVADPPGLQPFAPRSDFGVVSAEGLEFTANGTVQSVTAAPEPGTLPLFAAALGLGLLMRGRWRTRSMA
jgi:hypothetical protein